MTLGLVLGGGGVAGIAWEIGILAGLAEAGVEVGRPGRIVGTSAGAIVGAQIGAGRDVAAMLDAQLADEAPVMALGRTTHDLGVWAGLLLNPEPEDVGVLALMRRIGVMAGAAQTMPLEVYRAMIAGQLQVSEWPADLDFRVTAIAAATGELAVWRAESGVPLLDAVMASCAVPGLMPMVPINGRSHFDGGLVSPTHADQAEGCAEVLVIAPFAESVAGPALDTELDTLAASRTAVIVPDANSLAAFGTNPLVPSTRVPAALAGRAQGRAEAMRIGILLSL